MTQRLIKAAENIIAAFVRAFRWWFAQIGRQDTMRGKLVVACVGLLVFCTVCSIPVALVNGPSKSAPAAAVVPSVRPTTVEAPAPTHAPTETPKPATAPIATTVPPTATTAPTEAPSATPAPTQAPTEPPTAKPVAKPTVAPKPIAIPATSKLNTHGRDMYNCGDFATYAEAYAVYKANLPGDPNRLDKNKDGIPCESLPGAP